MRGVFVAAIGLCLLVSLVLATNVESEALCTNSGWCHE